MSEGFISSIRRRFIGDRNFYKKVLAIVMPIMLQNAVSTFVGLLDGIMIGRIGTEEMTGVSIANQLFFIYNLAIFGGLSGVGIFTVQYFGNRDPEGIRNTFRYKLWLGLIVTLTGAAIFYFFKDPLIELYLHDTDQSLDMDIIRQSGKDYMDLLLLSFPPFLLLQIYASTLRECEQTKIPMLAGVASFTVNLILNYIFIFGKLGLKPMGVRGAAIATVIARCAEASIMIIWSHTHRKEQPWVKGVYRTLRVPAANVRRFFIKGIPLLANELLWSMGIAFCNQCYSLRGPAVISAQSIANNLTQFTNIIFLSMGSAVGIIVGNLLGAGETKKAKDWDNKLIAFAMGLSLISMLLLFILCPFFPLIYDTTAEIREMATHMMMVTAVFVVQQAFLHCSYFTMRSGGKTVITFLFDSVSIWVLSATTAYCLSHFTNLGIIQILIFVSLADLIKVLAGYIMLRKNVWIHNIVSDSSTAGGE
ncbi:MAG: MATE family efflux transporter [Clostridiales bacterium]|nr:MATE family efflux transporter [Clostridiales bacterium]